MHECLAPGTLMKAQWCRSSYHSLHLCHLFSSWTPAILTYLCANRWHLYGKSWDVLLYGMDNALAQTTGGSSSLFFSTSPSYYFNISLEFRFRDSYTYYDLSINYLFWLKTAFGASNYSHFLNIFRITSFYDHITGTPLHFFLHLSMSVTKLNGYSTAAVTSLIWHTKQQWPWLNSSLCQCNELWKESMHCQRNCCTNQTPSGQNNARRS